MAWLRGGGVSHQDPVDNDMEDGVVSSSSSSSSTSSLERLLCADESISQRPLISRCHLSTPFVCSATHGRSITGNAVGSREPDAQAILRQKMLQQRQRALQQKQRAHGMVQPSENFTGEASMSMTHSNGQDGYPESFDCGSALDQLEEQPMLEQARPMPYGASSLGMPFKGPMMKEPNNPRSSPIALYDKDLSAIIVPDMMSADKKEEEARRRGFLQQELDERGICPVYDPTLHPSVHTGSQRDMNSDFWNISPAEMKSFLLRPAPKQAGMVECRIIRDRAGSTKFSPKYTMENDAGMFLMNAKKQKRNKTSNYSMTMSENNFDKETSSFLGKLRSSLLGLHFTSYDKGLNPKKIDASMPEVHAIEMAREELVSVQYSSSLWGSKPRGPRKMSVVVPRVQPNGQRLTCRSLHPEAEGLYALHKSSTATDLIDCFENKPPKWNDQIGAYVLNFNRRVTQASVKNFQLMSQEDPDTVFLQFGRVGKDVFNMDFRHPFSPFQAFAICLSSFDYKLCCE